MFSQFLFYINVAALLCLDPKGKNVCPKFVNFEINSKKVNNFSAEYCPDFYEKNNTCQLCPAGTYDYECERNCHPNYYGLQCKEKCNCLKGYMCNSVHGCIRNKTFISTNHTEYRILNSENITVVPHIESRSVFTQVVPVFAMCATLIGWLMMCVQNMKTNLCPKKLNKRCAWHNHHQNKKEKLSTSGSIRQNITKKVAFNTQQHITKTGNNPYCEPWEVTSIV